LREVCTVLQSEATLVRTPVPLSDEKADWVRRLLLRIDAWPVDSCWPEGHFLQVLGPAGAVETETLAVLAVDFGQHGRG
jgi:exoribonuclease R